MSILPKLGLMGAVALGPLLASATAQNEYFSRDKYEAVLDRQQPAYDPEPIRVGAFAVNTSAQAGVTANSNVFASSVDETSDIVLRIGGEAQARSNWANNEITAEVGVFRSEYMDISDESTTDAQARVRGRLDVTKKLSVNASGFVAQRNEQRQDFANAIGVDGPVGFDSSGAEIGASYRTGRLQWDGSFGVEKTDFEDAVLTNPGPTFGQEFDQDFRDNTRTLAQTRVTYAVTPDFAVFSQAALYNNDYDNLLDEPVPPGPIAPGTRLQSRRDSVGYTAAVGANFELSSLVRGDVAVGYLKDDKADGRFKDVNGLSVDARMTWFPTRLTNVTFTADRSVVDLGLLETPTALQTGVGVRVDHEFRRNIVGSVGLNLEQQDYDDVSRTDDVYDFSVVGTYKMNRRVHLEAFARQLGRDVSGVAQSNLLSHDISLIGIGVKISP